MASLPPRRLTTADGTPAEAVATWGEGAVGECALEEAVAAHRAEALSAGGPSAQRKYDSAARWAVRWVDAALSGLSLGAVSLIAPATAWLPPERWEAAPGLEAQSLAVWLQGMLMLVPRRQGDGAAAAAESAAGTAADVGMALVEAAPPAGAGTALVEVAAAAPTAQAAPASMALTGALQAALADTAPTALAEAPRASAGAGAELAVLPQRALHWVALAELPREAALSFAQELSALLVARRRAVTNILNDHGVPAEWRDAKNVLTGLRSVHYLVHSQHVGKWQYEVVDGADGGEGDGSGDGSGGGAAALAVVDGGGGGGGRKFRRDGGVRRAEEAVVAETLSELLSRLPGGRCMAAEAAERLAAALLKPEAAMVHATMAPSAPSETAADGLRTAPLLAVPMEVVAIEAAAKELPLHERPYRLYRFSSRPVSELLAYRIGHAAEDGHERRIDGVHRQLSQAVLHVYAAWMADGRLPCAPAAASEAQLRAACEPSFRVPFNVLEATVHKVLKDWPSLHRRGAPPKVAVPAPGGVTLDLQHTLKASSLKNLMASLRHHAEKLGPAVTQACSAQEVRECFHGALRELRLRVCSETPPLLRSVVRALFALLTARTARELRLALWLRLATALKLRSHEGLLMLHVELEIEVSSHMLHRSRPPGTRLALTLASAGGAV